jgi:hypothetical protein
MVEPVLQFEVRRGLCRGETGHGHAFIKRDLAALECVEQHVECHDLGQRGRIARLVGMPVVEDLLRVGIDDDRGVFFGLGCRRRRLP